MSVTKTPRKESAAVFVDLSAGDSLLYTVVVKGVQPEFTLVDSGPGALLLSNNDPPSSTSPLTFTRKWPNAGDTVQPVTDHTLGMLFPGAPITYTYKVDLVHANGSSEAVNDIDFQSNTPTDQFFQRLGVTTAQRKQP